MQNEPLISIVTPMYNAEKYIVETIDSVLNQSYKNWEMLIVDNCSTDKSRELVDSISDSRIKLIKLDFNSGGPAKPRNIGVENAQGEYIAFLDADDLWTKDKLETHLDFMEKNRLDFSSTYFQTIDTDNNLIDTGNKLSNYLKEKAKKDTIEYLIRENFIATSSVVLRKKFFSLFDESTEMIAVEDFCLWLRLFDREDVSYGYFDKKLLKYRIVESSTSERGIPYRQGVKALICILRFILESGHFEYIHPFSKRIIKDIYLRKKLKRFI